MTDTIDILLGEAPEVYQLFSYANPNLALTDVISHGFNQTLQRDMAFGSWADAYVAKGGQYRLKITSPTHDMAPYAKRITSYLEAGRVALAKYNEKVLWGSGFNFLLPFGLAMANVRSVQLFHFPPNECLFYSDYLYSPTNRRWECLLANNGFDGRDNTLLERIVDVVPIAAAGGAMKEIAPYNFDFLDYGKMQLEGFLDAVDGRTQPVVGYGGPVRDWLWKVYEDQIKAQLPSESSNNPLHTMSLVELEIVEGAKTPVLCANHPSMYLYDTGIPLDKAKEKVDGKYPAPMTVMREDLVAAGWQAAMSAKWDADATDTLKSMQDRWSSDDKVLKIMAEQNTEFGFSK